MNCTELQQELPDILESACNAEQEAHLNFCAACAELLSDLNAITDQARLLQGFDEEPSPRVWNSIEIVLRQEGIIREPKHELTIVHRSRPRRSLAWLLPVTAALVVTVGVFRYERGQVRPQFAQNTAPVAASLQPASLPAALQFSPADDEQLLEVVSSRSPAMRDSYAMNLQNVNAYIRDAEQSARTNPNDEASQQYLMDAYEQKAMVYNMALDRSLP